MLTLVFAVATAAVAATPIVLPGGAPIGMDYLAYDAAQHRVWVPAGNTGNVDIVDTETRTVTSIGGFATKPATKPGRPAMGPSSASVGDGVVWVGNRGDNSVCGFDAASLEKRACVTLPSMPDGIQYVAATKELWATTPDKQTLTIIDVSSKMPIVQSSIALPGDPEGYAIDATRGVFYTNLEDKNQTVTVDLKTRKVLSVWPSGCGNDGPRGIAVDGARDLLIVACTDGAVTLDLRHGGKVMGRLTTGKGVDDIAHSIPKRRLYVASREDGMLTLATVGNDGKLTATTTVATTKGSRNSVIDAEGTAYVPDTLGGRLLVIKAP